MRRLIAMLTVLVATSSVGWSAEEPVKNKAADPMAGYQELVHQGKAGKLAYRFLAPADYDAKATNSYPLLLLLHGAGERGTDNKAQLKWGGREAATDLQAVAKCFVIAPQCPPNKQWVNTPWGKGVYSTAKVPISDELTLAIEVVEKVVAEYKIDKSRVYVMGLSMGGYGTWDALARRPDLFAAGVPICGAGDPESAQKLKDAGVAIWAFHGDKDTVVPTAGSREMVAAFKKISVTEPQLKYTEFPGVGHNAWSPTWKTAGLWEWLTSQKKGK